jgi:DEAD/DEAH box helicase domain-containing protein
MQNKINSKLEILFQNQIRSHQILKETPGVLTPFPQTLHPKLQLALKQSGIIALYNHQLKAFNLISANSDTLIISKTASGKTLSFLLPILNEYLYAPSPFSVLLMYPTKALSRDQENVLSRLMKAAGIPSYPGTFDGDTPREERERITRSSDFITTNPDMLHGGILPNHNRRWRNFLSRLRYVVVDEVHTYRGAYGSHAANVFRRLNRVCTLHGSNPVYIGASATIGNPLEHAEALFLRRFSEIGEDSSPRPRRDLYLINPEVRQSHGGAVYRKGPSSVSVPLMIEACRQKVRTICFCRARQEVERLYQAVSQREPNLRNLIKPYRGGLLPDERRKLERDFFSGKINVIITTNALEMGIDIGDLDLCILSGFPGTTASFWQQAGRVGRKTKPATIAFIAKESPVDQYMMRHPEFLFGAPLEKAWLNANNPYILLQHLPCAAWEHPLSESEAGYDPTTYQAGIEILKQNQSLLPWQNAYRYALQDYPAKGVNLRGMTDYNIEIFCGSEVIGEIDPIGAMGTLYKDAIYQHLGLRYLSLNLDMQKKLCEVTPVNVDYFTEASWENRIHLSYSLHEKFENGHLLQSGTVHLNLQPKLYKKIREKSFENIGYGPITLDPFQFDTMGFALVPAQAWVLAMNLKDKRWNGSALYGLAALLRKLAPGFAMADPGDIGTDVSLSGATQNGWKSALYFYDNLEGGAGFAEVVYDNFTSVLRLCLQAVDECECECGCPSCIPPLPPGVEDESLAQFMTETNSAVECTRSLLHHLLSGQLIFPQIRSVERSLNAPDINPFTDHQSVLLKKKMEQAALILKHKKEKLH